MNGTAPSPASGPIPATIPLNPPPIELALVQVRFAPVLSVAQDEFFGAFQQELLAEYPLTTKDHELVIGPDMAARTTDLWRMDDERGAWRVTLTSGFVAFETRAYPGKAPFFERLGRVLDAVERHVRPPRVERVGVRYVCRIEDETDLARLDELVRPEVVGVARQGADEPTLALTQCSYDLGDATLGARFGLIPAGLVFEPMLRTAEGRSWILDVDVFDEHKRPFEAETLAAVALDYSRLQYRFFRWAIQPEFLRRFGADPEIVAALESHS